MISCFQCVHQTAPVDTVTKYIIKGFFFFQCMSLAARVCHVQCVHQTAHVNTVTSPSMETRVNTTVPRGVHLDHVMNWVGSLTLPQVIYIYIYMNYVILLFLHFYGIPFMLHYIASIYYYVILVVNYESNWSALWY